jgi:hypothetical protein
LKWVTASRMNNSGMQDRSWCVICWQLIWSRTCRIDPDIPYFKTDGLRNWNINKK